MKILTIHLGHDNNICIYDSETLDFSYIKEERLSGDKHSPKTDKIIELIKELSFDIVVIAFTWMQEKHQMDLYHYYSSGNELYSQKQEKIKYIRKHFPKIKINEFPIDGIFRKYHKLLEETNNLNIPVYCVQHDYAHILSGWMLGINHSYGISIDGGGPDYNNKLILKNPFDIKNVEVLFFSRLTCNINNADIVLEDFGYKNSLGVSLGLIGKLMKLSGMTYDFAGKIMGMSAYGNINTDIVKRFNNAFIDVTKFQMVAFIKRLFREKLNIKRIDVKNGHYTSYCNFKNQDFLDIVTSIQYIWKKTVLLLFNKFIPKNSAVIYSGGCAQNTITNKALLNDYPNLDIVPHCYDGGLSLGCLAFVILKHNLQFPKLENFPYIQTDMSVDPPSETTIKQVAKLLAEGKIVGWYQGHGEVGPRALGNRSILMNPSIENAKDILNSKVKHREHWRPFAPSIMEEYASDWFDIEKSKYMMIAANVHEDKRKLIPAVTHKDGSSRIQTVTLEDNKIFYNLLKEFYSITNIPMLLNTSLNKGGGPIVGDPSQAIDIYNDTELDALCVGDRLYIKN